MPRRSIVLKTSLLPVLLAAVVMAGLSVWTAQAQQPDGVTASITDPASGQQLFGQVQIRGSAAHPTAFQSYTLEYDDLSNPDIQWMLVQPRVQQQVQEGILGAWNTIVVPDGVYQLRLRVFLSDDQVGEFTVSNLRVVNSAPTPLPTSGSQMGSDIPTPGPSPTSPIAQPPSSNPDMDLEEPVLSQEETSGLSPSLVSSEESPKTRINTGRIWRAFCSGVYLTLGAFGIMFVYLLLRGRLRPITRRLVWQIRDDDQR